MPRCRGARACDLQLALQYQDGSRFRDIAHVAVCNVCKKTYTLRSSQVILLVMQEHETNTGWWIEKPERPDRPSSYAPLGGSSPARRRRGGVWMKALLVISLMVALGWAILRLAAP